MRARIVAWCLALLALPTWVLGADTPAKFTSYRDIETAYHSQSAELNELRMRLASLEEEVTYSAPPQASYIDGNYAHGGGSGCCEPCACEACCCEPAAMFYAGVEAVWLKPHFRSADAYVRSPDPNNAIFAPFDYDFEISPRVWLGYKAASGTGARVRYWQWDHLAASAAAVANPGEELFATAQFIGLDSDGIGGQGTAGVYSTHALDLETIDLEMTRDLCVGVSIIRFAAGIRYLDLGQKYNAYTFGTAPVPIEALQYTQDFEGIGPTFGLELGHDLGCSFSFYAMARGSVLFGNRSDQLTLTTIGLPTANAIRSKADEMITIGEIGMGFEANFGGIFARAGYEGQIWFDTGTPNYGAGNMGLHGFNVTSGVMF